MGIDCQFRKNYYFCLSFHSKRRTEQQTAFNKKYLLEQIFRPAEMSFTNPLCVVTVSASCRDKLLMQNLILASENYFLLFFQILLPPKVTFTSSENIFFNEFFILASGNSMLLFGAFLLLLDTMIEIRGINFNRKIFSCQWKTFSFLCQKKQLLRIVETYFSTNASFLVVETDFLASTNHKLFLFQQKRILSKFFILAVAEGFFLQWKASILLECSFLLGETVTGMSGNHFLKTDLILSSENSFSSQWKTFSSIASDIFQEFLHSGQWKQIFQSRGKSIVFYLQHFLLLVEPII